MNPSIMKKADRSKYIVYYRYVNFMSDMYFEVKKKINNTTYDYKKNRFVRLIFSLFTKFN